MVKTNKIIVSALMILSMYGGKNEICLEVLHNIPRRGSYWSFDLVKEFKNSNSSLKQDKNFLSEEKKQDIIDERWRSVIEEMTKKYISLKELEPALKKISGQIKKLNSLKLPVDYDSLISSLRILIVSYLKCGGELFDKNFTYFKNLVMEALNTKPMASYHFFLEGNKGLIDLYLEVYYRFFSTEQRAQFVNKYNNHEIKLLLRLCEYNPSILMLWLARSVSPVSIEYLSFFLANGEDSNSYDNKTGNTLLMVILENFLSEDEKYQANDELMIEKINLLLNYPTINLTISNYNGETFKDYLKKVIKKEKDLGEKHKDFVKKCQNWHKTLFIDNI